ncbi:HEC/Ndc80p family protein [Trichuris suis]|nr:HEC/Ndc80p family protein [Trichuris suis]
MDRQPWNPEILSNLGPSPTTSLGGRSVRSYFSSHSALLQTESNYRGTCSTRGAKSGGKPSVGRMILDLVYFFQTVPSLELSEKKVKEMARSTFTKMFEHLVSRVIDERYTMGPLETDVPRMLKLLGYPLLPKKSTLQTLGAPNSLPLIVQMLYWLMSLIKFQGDFCSSDTFQFIEKTCNLDSEAALFSQWLAGANVLDTPVDSAEMTELREQLKKAENNIETLQKKQMVIREQMKPLLNMEKELQEKLNEKMQLEKVVENCLIHQESCKKEIEDRKMQMRALQDENEAIGDQLLRLKVTRMQRMEIDKQNMEKIQQAQLLTKKAESLRQHISKQHSELAKERIIAFRISFQLEELRKKTACKLQELMALCPEVATVVKSLQRDQPLDEAFLSSLHGTVVEVKVKNDERLLEMKFDRDNMKKTCTALENDVAELKRAEDKLEKELENMLKNHELVVTEARERISSLRCQLKELREDPIFQGKEDYEKLESELLAKLDEAEIAFCKDILEKNKERMLAIHELKIHFQIFESLFGIGSS